MNGKENPKTSARAKLHSRIEALVARCGAGSVRCSLIVVPQIQLSPFVSALIYQYIKHDSDIFVVFHPTGNRYSGGIFEISERFIGINVAERHDDIEGFVAGVLEEVKGFGFSQLSVLLHPFAQGVNSIVWNNIDILGDKISVSFYADGSRNNLSIGWNRDSGEYPLLQALNRQSVDNIFCFGFDSVSTEPDWSPYREGINVDVVDYAFVDFVFLDRGTKTFGPDDRDWFQDGKERSLVLSRYWGRDPYYFVSDSDAAEAYLASVEGALNGNGAGILYRGDNRSNKWIGEDLLRLGAEDFNTLFGAEGFNSDELLFEVFIHDNPEVLRNLSLIYCFDSSFPLIFQSPRLWSLLSDESEIVVGFSYETVSRLGRGVCVDVMLHRVACLVRDVSQIDLFRVYSDDGPVLGVGQASEAEIRNRLIAAGGFFRLRKF